MKKVQVFTRNEPVGEYQPAVAQASNDPVALAPASAGYGGQSAVQQGQEIQGAAAWAQAAEQDPELQGVFGGITFLQRRMADRAARTEQEAALRASAVQYDQHEALKLQLAIAEARARSDEAIARGKASDAERAKATAQGKASDAQRAKTEARIVQAEHALVELKASHKHEVAAGTGGGASDAQMSVAIDFSRITGRMQAGVRAFRQMAEPMAGDLKPGLLEDITSDALGLAFSILTGSLLPLAAAQVAKIAIARGLPKLVKSKLNVLTESVAKQLFTFGKGAFTASAVDIGRYGTKSLDAYLETLDAQIAASGTTLKARIIAANKHPDAMAAIAAAMNQLIDGLKDITLERAAEGWATLLVRTKTGRSPGSEVHLLEGTGRVDTDALPGLIDVFGTISPDGVVTMVSAKAEMPEALRRYESRAVKPAADADPIGQVAQRLGGQRTSRTVGARRQPMRFIFTLPAGDQMVFGQDEVHTLKDLTEGQAVLQVVSYVYRQRSAQRLPEVGHRAAMQWFIERTHQGLLNKPLPPIEAP